MGNLESMESTQLPLPKHILDIWVIVLIILGTIVIMTLLRPLFQTTPIKENQKGEMRIQQISDWLKSYLRSTAVE